MSINVPSIGKVGFGVREGISGLQELDLGRFGMNTRANLMYGKWGDGVLHNRALGVQVCMDPYR